MTTDEAVAKTQALLEGLLKSMEFEGSVTARAQGDAGILLSVDSPDASTLVGEEGQLLEAIQYTMNRMLRRTLGEEWFCVLDIGGYRERRRDVMAKEALDIAARVRQSGRPFTFPALSASDRRAVHRALADDPDLETVSLEPSVDGFKRLVIQLRPPPPPVEPQPPANDAPPAQSDSPG
jgi:spoIIIJ-associated protein